MLLMPYQESNYLEFIDYHLEELYYLGLNHKFNKYNRMLLYGILTNHANNCKVNECQLNKSGQLYKTIFEENKEIDEAIII